MAGQHGAGVNIGRSPATALLAEKNRLVSSIVGSSLGAGGIHAATIKAVGKFLSRFSQGEIPWVRMYQAYPDWQRNCGLLNEEWDRDTVTHRARVVFTLITPLRQGRGFSREALGGGSWKSTGAESIASREVVLSKLYYKRDDGSKGGFTVFEFHLTADHQLKPRVAVCVLHPTDHRDCVRDLKQYRREGRFPGQILQGNLQVMQDVLPNYQDPSVAGSISMNGPHVPVSNSGFGGQHSDELPMLNDFCNTFSATTSTEDLAPWDWDGFYSNNYSFTQDGL